MRWPAFESFVFVNQMVDVDAGPLWSSLRLIAALAWAEGGPAPWVASLARILRARQEIAIFEQGGSHS